MGLMIDDLKAALNAVGLLFRGGFAPGPGETLPKLESRESVAFVAMIGNAGPALWKHFAASPERGDGKADPMNRWTRRVVLELAERFGAKALFAFDGPPYHPFQRWAQRAEPVYPSPLGILIHPRYGLWHAYRAALLLSEPLPVKAAGPGVSPCDSCREKPCLSACPVGAFTGSDYRVADCAAHVGSPLGGDCRAGFCRARRACPVGLDYIYDQEQAAFHMAAFVSAHSPCSE